MKKSLFVIFYVSLLVLLLFVGVMIGRSDRSEFTNLSLHNHKLTTVPVDNSGTNKLDINSATAEDFSQLEGIGEVIADRIVQYRQKHGPFDSIYDLLKVEGIGEGKFGKIQDYICVGG